MMGVEFTDQNTAPPHFSRYIKLGTSTKIVVKLCTVVKRHKYTALLVLRH